MKLRSEVSTADWPEALILAAWLILWLFVVPGLPLILKGVFQVLITGGAVWTGVIVLRDRWRQSKTASAFVGYCLCLVGIALAIILAYALLILVIVRVVAR